MTMAERDTSENRNKAESDDRSGNRKSRRGFVGLLSGVLVVVAAGVLGLFGWQYITRPEVVDLDITRRDGMKNVYTVVVANDGGPGGVLVILTLNDAQNNVLVRREREVTMTEGEQREVEFLIDTPETSDEFQAEVEGTDFPERLVG